jgi:hypothetical protein
MPNFFLGKNSKFCKDNALESEFIFAKYTCCKNWTKIVGQSGFGARIYPRGLALGE